MVDVGKAIERLLRTTNTVIEATRQKYSAASDGREVKARDAYHDSLNVLRKTWERLDARLHHASSDEEKATCAPVWLKAHVDKKLLYKLERLLVTMRGYAEAAVSTSRHLSSRCEDSCALSFRGAVNRHTGGIVSQ